MSDTGRLTQEERDRYEALQDRLEELSQKSNEMTDGSYIDSVANRQRDDDQNQLSAEQDMIREEQRQILEDARRRS